MRLRSPGPRLSILLLVSTLCGLAIACGVVLSTPAVEERGPSTETEAVAVDMGDMLVARMRIVNNEGQDLHYSYYVLLNHSSGREKEYTGTVSVGDGCSYGLAVNLYPDPGCSASVLIRIYNGAASEPFDEIVFHFPPAAIDRSGIE